MRIENATKLIVSASLAAPNCKGRQVCVEIQLPTDSESPHPRKLVEASQRAIANAVEELMNDAT